MPSGVQQTSIRQNKYLIWNLKSKKYIYRIKNKEACSTNSLMTLIGRTLKDNNIAVVFLCTWKINIHIKNRQGREEFSLNC